MDKIVDALAKKAGEADKAHDALQFSQAACNVANAQRVLVDTKAQEKK